MDSTVPHSSRQGGLEAVYLDRRDALVRFLRARGAGEHAEDLVQELWLKIAAAPPTAIADPVGYLYRAANNVMISRYRSSERAGQRDDRWQAAGPPEERSAEDAVAAKQDIARAEQRLRALGDRVFDAFILFRVDGISQREIAERLGISLSAVEKDLQRAYRAIAGLKEDRDAE